MFLLAQFYLISVFYLFCVFLTMILIQGIVYRLTGFSIYNFVYAQLLKECGYNIKNRHKKRYVCNTKH